MSISSSELLAPNVQEYATIGPLELDQIDESNQNQNSLYFSTVTVSGEDFVILDSSGDTMSGIDRLLQEKVRGNYLEPAVQSRRQRLYGMLWTISSLDNDRRHHVISTERLIRRYRNDYPLVSETAQALRTMIVAAENEEVKRKVAAANEAFLDGDETVYAEVSYVDSSKFDYRHRALGKLAGFGVNLSSHGEFLNPEALLADPEGHTRRMPGNMGLVRLLVKA